MAINLAIRLSHPSATSAFIRYARVDNTSNPTYVVVSPNPAIGTDIRVITVATNLPNGQYEVQATPVYADQRTCAASSFYTAACPGLIAINAYVNGGNVIVTWTADPSIPKARITVNFPNGGQSIANYVNNATQNITPIPIPPGNNGTISVFGQSVCDESTGFYSAASNQVAVNNNSGSDPIAGQYRKANSTSLICNFPPVTLYTNGAFGIGKIVYSDSSLSIPAVGAPYIAEASTGKIYTISTATAEVTGDTGQYCNVLVSNGWLTNNYTINTITGIPGFTFPGAGLLVGTDYMGTRTGAGTFTIAVNVSANVPATGKLTLLKNEVLVECLNVAGNATYTFAATSFLATDLIEIQADTGSC